MGVRSAIATSKRNALRPPAAIGATCPNALTSPAPLRPAHPLSSAADTVRSGQLTRLRPIALWWESEQALRS